MSGSIVALSGGLDSTTCLAIATAEAAPVLAVTFDYGQRHGTELERARQIAVHYAVEHLVIRLDASQWGGSALTDARIDVPNFDDRDTAAPIPVTYVPARNLIFLSVAVGIAEVRDLDGVYLGVNSLDYSGYPDCRPEFVASFAQTAALALKRGVEGRPVEIRTPLVDKTKADIVRLAVARRVPLAVTWSCYRGDDRPCGTCDACHLRAKGFAEAGVTDPALVC